MAVSLSANTCRTALHDYSPTGALSTTVCVADPNGTWAKVDKKNVHDFARFGEVARLDTSLLQCVLVTYFDVRSAQKALLEMICSAEPFPEAAHEVRTVCVSLAAFQQLYGADAGFAQFGEVANIMVLGTDAVVEFYDFRAAQALLCAACDCAAPWTAQAQAVFAAMQSPKLAVTSLAQAALLAEEPPQSDMPEALKPSSPARTKITNKDFTKYDIDPEKIASGEDERTTVMVRNLVGQHARKNFLAYLEKCGLQDRHNFFYMPCKEHRNVPVGFAFVNFMAAEDVHRLYMMMTTELWSELIRDPQSSKAPAVAYARFQGQEELMKHFNSSAVISRRNPEKRPNFRQVQSQDGGTGGVASPSQSPIRAKLQVHSSALASSKDEDLQTALTKGVQTINAMLAKDKTNAAMAKIDNCAPAYLHSTYTENSLEDATWSPQHLPAKLDGILENEDPEFTISSFAVGG